MDEIQFFFQEHFLSFFHKAFCSYLSSQIYPEHLMPNIFLLDFSITWIFLQM